MPEELASTKLTQSLDQIKALLKRWIFEATEPVVVALKGGWGEGKTFFWKNSVTPGYSREQVGYASVFGADTLQAIRERVLLAALPKVPADSTSAVGKVAEAVRQAAPAILRGFGVPDNLATGVLENTVLKRGWILCLDDIERISQSVGIDALLGYINELKEERGIKVVLIYNDEALQDDKFRRYQEKVIDREVPFSPDVPAILRLVFQATPSVANDSRLMSELTRRCNVLELRNIRLIGKTRNYYQEVERVLPNMDAPYRQAVLSALLLFVWIKFSKPSVPALTFEFLADYSELAMIMRAEKRASSERPADDERATARLKSYGYKFTDDLDIILMAFVKTDVLDEEQLRTEHEKYRLNVSKGILEKHFSDAWQKLFHGTLKDNETEFCAELAAGTRVYLQYIPLNQLDSALRMLSQLGRGAEADTLLNEFLQLRGEDLKQFRRNQLVEPIRFEKLDQILRNIEVESATDRRTIGETIETALKDDLIPSRDRQRLAEFSKEDYVRYFQATDMDHLTSTIRQLANQARRFSNPDEVDRKIQDTVREAVKEIAALSRINRIRMESMGLIEAEASSAPG